MRFSYGSILWQMVVNLNKSITVTGLEFLHLANGKIIEEWINEDFLEQLGAVAAPGQADASVKRES